MTAAAKIIQNLAAQDIHLNLEGDKIKLVSNHKPDDQTLDEIRLHKPELISFLSGADERAAIAEYDGMIPREWASAFAKLQFMERPEQYRPEEWERVLNDAGLFADKWASQAIKLGWTILDVFAVHKSGNCGRLDGEGVILSIRGCKVVAITADHIIIETGTAARQRICKPTAEKKAIKAIFSVAPAPRKMLINT